MISLFFEIPVIIGAIEFSRIVLLDPLAQVAFPYLKTSSKHESGYTTHVQCLTAAILYYYLVENFLFLPIYFLQIFIGAIIICSILCKLTPLWEILITSLKFDFNVNVNGNVKKVEKINNLIINDLITVKKQQQQLHNESLIENSERKRFLQLMLPNDNNKLSGSGYKKSIKFNQNVQLIIMNASILVKLTKLLSLNPQSSSHHHLNYRKNRSLNMNFLPISTEKTKFSSHKKNNLLICDSQGQVKSIEKIKTFFTEFSKKQDSIDTTTEIHVASPGDLFLSKKINELDKDLVELTEHENVVRKLVQQQKKQDNNYEITKKIQEDLICQIKRIDNQKQQYQVQAQENVISKDVTKLSIPAFTVQRENSKKFATYVIMVQKIDALTSQAKAGWVIPRRYNEFSLLNQHLRKHYSEFIDKVEFPRKTLFNNLGNSFLESRRVQLENYLQGLLIKDEVCEDKEFLKFLSKGN